MKRNEAKTKMKMKIETLGEQSHQSPLENMKCVVNEKEIWFSPLLKPKSAMGQDNGPKTQ